MKIHINKEKIEKKGFFGGSKSWTVVKAFYELNNEERELLNSNKNILEMTVFDLPFRGPDGKPSGPSPSVRNLTNPKYSQGEGCTLGCFFSNGEIQHVEDLVHQGAKDLKAELYGGSSGSSVTEI